MLKNTNIFQSLLFIFSFIFLLFFPLFWSSWIPEARFISLAMFFCLGIVWILLRARSNQPFLISKGVILFLVYLVLQTGLLFLSPVAKYGVAKLLNNFTIFALYIFFADSLRVGWKAKTWEYVLVILAMLISVVGSLTILLWASNWWQISGEMFSIPPVGIRIPGTILAHPNPVAGFINLALFVVIIRVWTPQKKIQVFLWIGLFLLFLIALYFTSSRAAWVGLVAGIMITSLLINLPHLHKLLDTHKKGILAFSTGVRSKIRTRHLLIMLAGSICGAGLVFLLVWNIKYVGHGGLSVRMDYWKSALELISSSPFWGHGPASYPFLIAQRSEQFYDEVLYYHPHNILLQILAETGIIGTAILLIFCWIIGRSFISIWRETPFYTFEKKRLAAYAGAALAVAIQHFVDILFLQMLYTLAIFIILAIALRNDTHKENIAIGKKGAFVLIIGLLAGIMVGNLYIIRGAGEYGNGLLHAREGNWEDAQLSICRAAEMDKSDPLYSFQCGLANGFAYFYQSDNESLKKAIEYTRRGLLIDPYWYVHWANLATFEWMAGSKYEALKHMQYAAINSRARSIDKWILYFNLGWMEEELGNHNNAIIAYRTAMFLNPWLMLDNYFHETRVREEARQGVSKKGFIWDGWNALNRGDIGEAELEFSQLMERNPGFPLGYILLAVAQQKQGQFISAWKNVQTALFIENSDFRILLYSRRIAYSQNRTEEAIMYLDRAFDVVDDFTMSDMDYDAAYHQNFLPSDLSPFLFRPMGLTTGDKEAFYRLAEHYYEMDNEMKSKRIMDWVQINGMK
jgi:O-antigen ligase